MMIISEWMGWVGDRLVDLITVYYVITGPAEWILCFSGNRTDLSEQPIFSNQSKLLKPCNNHFWFDNFPALALSAVEVLGEWKLKSCEPVMWRMETFQELLDTGFSLCTYHIDHWVGWILSGSTIIKESSQFWSLQHPPPHHLDRAMLGDIGIWEGCEGVMGGKPVLSS